METKTISADCTRRHYRRKFATGKLYERLKKCLIYGIIAAVLILITPLLDGSGWPLSMFCVVGMNLIPVLLAVLTRSKFWAIAAAVISTLWMGCILFSGYRWIADLWSQLTFFGFEILFFSSRVRDTAVFLCLILSGGLGIRCAAKMLGIFKEIDAEYNELMANLRV